MSICLILHGHASPRRFTRTPTTTVYSTLNVFFCNRMLVYPTVPGKRCTHSALNMYVTCIRTLHDEIFVTERVRQCWHARVIPSSCVFNLSQRGLSTTSIAFRSHSLVVVRIATALVLTCWSSRASLSSGDASKNVGNQRATTTWWWHPLVWPRRISADGVALLPASQTPSLLALAMGSSCLPCPRCCHGLTLRNRFDMLCERQEING